MITVPNRPSMVGILTYIIDCVTGLRPVPYYMDVSAGETHRKPPAQRQRPSSSNWQIGAAKRANTRASGLYMQGSLRICAVPQLSRRLGIANVTKAAHCTSKFENTLMIWHCSVYILTMTRKEASQSGRSSSRIVGHSVGECGVSGAAVGMAFHI